ncbi:MAG TPA: universal stress protein [Dehalococcoidia bacterium]|nr:universal stress protein [Dehalococcoidia bacterium]
MRTLLVPLDGGPLAETALPYAEAIARGARSEVVLFTAVDRQRSSGVHECWGLGQETAWARSYLEGKRRRLESLGLTVRVEMAYGPAAHCILRAAQQLEDPLIVMAGRPPREPGPWSRGGVSIRVVEAAGCPVLLVRDGGGTRPLGGVLLPLDGSALSLSVLSVARDLCVAVGARAVLLHVVALGGLAATAYASRGYLAEALSLLQEEALAMLEEVAEDLRRSGVRVETRVAVGHAINQILRTAQEAGTDVIALSSHGRSGQGRPTMGSVAQAVLQRSTIPCLLVKPAEAVGAGGSS